MRVRLLANAVLIAAATIGFGVEHSDAVSRPVVVIPGIMGSKLCDGAGNVLWGDRSSYTASRIAALRLPADINSRDMSIHSCGLIESVSIIPLFWESNVYSGLIETLHKIGYDDKDIIVFDYDWRLSNFDNAQLLNQRVERAIISGADGKIDFIAHSMGGLIARIYIQQLGGAAKIQNLILMGTPNLGSAKIFQRLRDGFDNWPISLSGGIVEIERTILSFPSTYQLLPTYDECCGFSADGNAVTANYIDILDSRNWSKFSWLPEDYKAGARFKALSTFLVDAQKLKEVLKAPIFNNADGYARMHFIANGFLDTWSRVFFDPNTGAISANTVSPGDGTVLLYSATNRIPSQVQVSLKEHELIFIGREPELIIKAALSGQTWTAGHGDFSQIIVDAKNAKFSIRSEQLEVVPRVAAAGQNVLINITLQGSEDIKNADLANIEADILQDDSTIITARFSDVPAAAGMRSLQGGFVAPLGEGPYRIRVRIPGLEDNESIFAVWRP